MPYEAFLEALAERQSAEATADALELTLWRLVKHDQMTTARTRRQPGGLELCIYVGDELFWSHLFAPGREHLLEVAANAKRADFIKSGWSAVS